MVCSRSFCISLIALFFTGIGIGQHINEFHYDNTGSDEGEFIEIVIVDPQPVNLIEYKVYLYRSSDGTSYRSRSLNGITPTCSSGMCYYVWSVNPIQNGPNGIAIVQETISDTTLYDFISYEGAFTATDGGAKGVSSIDIGISEDGNTPVGWSLQERSDGTWFAGPETRGSVNPIELLSFEAKYVEERNGVLVAWQTASEINNQFFEIQRSLDQQSFWTIAKIEGAGNSQEIRKYSYFDQVQDRKWIFYRLKQTDYDGSVSYSWVISIRIHSENTLRDVRLITRPNNIQLHSSGYKHPIDIALYDAIGRKLFSREKVHTGEYIPVSIPLRGIVFYHLQSRGMQHTDRLLIMGK